jgi:hypothetical protein
MADINQDLRLLVLFSRTEAAMSELITGLLDVGITGMTVLDTTNLGTIMQRDMPIFAALAELLPKTTGNRIMMSLCNGETIRAVKRVVREMQPDHQPIALVLPIEEMFGHEMT